MYNLENIRAMHVELSTDCNASCPVCNRNFFGGKTHSWIPKTQITFLDFKKFFSPKLIQQLDFILFCGNYGDPAMAKDLVEIVEYTYTCNRSIIIQINTNGGTRSERFWSQLGKMIKEPSNITFSVDGLEDTNHIYRRGVNWDNVLRSMNTFISSGGNAHWDFLVFKHNEHQIEKAQKFAMSLGISKFIPKKAFGFTSKGNKQLLGVYNSDNTLDYDIYPPSSEFQNREISNSDGSIEEHVSASNMGEIQRFYSEIENLNTPPYIDPDYSKKLSDTKINCYSLKQQEIFVSAEGLLFPCCFTASRLYGLNKDNFSNWQFQKHTQKFKRSTFSLYENKLEDILKSEFLSQSFQDSWSCKDLKTGKLAICSEFCGKSSVGLESVFHLD
jgi:MoaA/NifB/PqqE/SkfB family radical SAM enzyme